MAVAAVGAWLESTKPPIDDLARETDRIETRKPSSDGDALVLAAYQRAATQLPAMRLLVRESMEGVSDLELFYDGDSMIREEYGGSPRIYGKGFMAEQRRLLNSLVWVVTEQSGELAAEGVIRATSFGPVNCVAGWESLGTEVLIGRTTRHVRCTWKTSGGGTSETHFWIDLETGLPLRTASPVATAYGQSAVPMYIDIVELEIGPQPESLFALEGGAMSEAEYECAAGIAPCSSAVPTELPPPASTQPAGPVLTPPPAPGPANPPADLDTFVAEVQAAYERTEPVEIRIEPPTEGFVPTRWLRDGLGNHRVEYGHWDEDGYQGAIWLFIDGHAYEKDPAGGKPWREWSYFEGFFMQPTFGLPDGCGFGWTYLGDDLVLDRPAAHVSCGLQEYWIDREWMLVTRAHDHDPFVGDSPSAGLSQVISVTFGPQPAELFVAPSPDEVWR